MCSDMNAATRSRRSAARGLRAKSMLGTLVVAAMIGSVRIGRWMAALVPALVMAASLSACDGSGDTGGRPPRPDVSFRFDPAAAHDALAALYAGDHPSAQDRRD